MSTYGAATQVPGPTSKQTYNTPLKSGIFVFLTYVDDATTTANLLSASADYVAQFSVLSTGEVQQHYSEAIQLLPQGGRWGEYNTAAAIYVWVGVTGSSMDLPVAQWDSLVNLVRWLSGTVTTTVNSAWKTNIVHNILALEDPPFLP